MLKAKAAEDKKNKDEEKLDKLTTESGSSESLASPKSLAVEKRLTPSNSVAARKSAEAKAAEGSISAVETSSQASAPGKPSAPGETVVPAKALLSGKVTSLSKVKAPIPVTHLSQGGKQVSESGHASLMGGKSDDTEMVKLATVKKPSPKMRGSLPSNDNQSLYVSKPCTCTVIKFFCPSNHTALCAPELVEIIATVSRCSSDPLGPRYRGRC